MKRFRVLIAGGSGFVGRNLVRIFHTSDYDMGAITVIDKDERNLEYVKNYGVKVVCADVGS